ncbi:MAG: hypothetical protein FWG83_04745 [Oscillospiraceae bacterium]|nr:hypothetical protein [Oscillospiraceae bacterium]
MKTRNRLLSLFLAVTMIIGLAIPITIVSSQGDEPEPIRLEWSINEPRDEAVTQQGTSNHVMKIDLGLTEEDIPVLKGGSGLIRINYRDGQTVGSSRRITAWTDISGTAEEIADISFASPVNLASGKLARTNALASTETSGTIQVPSDLLYNDETGDFATELYIIINVNNDLANDAGNNRGGGSQNEFGRLGTIIFTITPSDEKFTDPVAEWNFLPANYPDVNVGEVNPGTPHELAGAKELLASGGPQAGTAALKRHEIDAWTSSPGTKHMVLENATSGFLRTFGWVHNDNYVYLEFSTIGLEDLVLQYEVKQNGSSAPQGLLLQYSLDAKRWTNIRRGNIDVVQADTRIEYLPKEISGQEKVYIRWVRGDTTGTSGSIDFKHIRLFDVPGIEHPPICEGCEDGCSECTMYVFPFPLEKTPNMTWAAGLQLGWESNLFDNPYGTKPTRMTSGARYMVLEFNEAPDYWGVYFQDTTWWVYSLLHEEFGCQDNICQPNVPNQDGEIICTGDCYTPGLEDMKTELPGGRVRYVIDFDTAFPERVFPGAGDDPRPGRHPGFSSSALYGTFQITFHSKPPSAPEESEQDWDVFMSKLSSAYFTNMDPNTIEPEVETTLKTWDPITAHTGQSIESIDVSGQDGLKLYYDYTSSGISDVRLQYSVDGGNEWSNIHRSFSIIKTDPVSSGKRMEILPRETYEADDLQIRWIPHGIWGETDWGEGEFTVNNARLVSGIQKYEQPRLTSLIVGIESLTEQKPTINQRGTYKLDAPQVKLHSIASFTTNTNTTWESDDNEVARAITEIEKFTSSTGSSTTVTGATVRAFSEGKATIRVSSVVDPSIYTEFTVDVNAIQANPNIMYTITSPYSHVDWDTFAQYKAALHTHTLNSDGANSTAESAEQHYALGYNIQAFTDHSYTTITPDDVRIGAMTRERIEEMGRGEGRDGNGMIFIPGGNEHSSMNFADITQRPTGHHVNTYWSFIHSERTEIAELVSRVNDETNGSLIQINHPGRYTGSQWETPWNLAFAIANNPANYMPYADVYRENHQLLSLMEIINKFDTESQADRVLWDNVLSVNMPHGVPTFGTSNDDSHSNAAIGFSYNLLVMPELSLNETRYAMDNGSFFAFSRVDRQYRIYPSGINQWDWDANTIPGTGRYDATRKVLEMPVPEITGIRVDNENAIITIDAEITHTNGAVEAIDNSAIAFIDWYADGIRVHRGKTLDLKEHQLSIYSYVRATVAHRSYGALYTQPFEVQIRGQERALPNLVSIDEIELADIDLDSGMPKSKLEQLLPAAVKIVTDQDTIEDLYQYYATIKWDLSSYDPANPDVRDILGTVMLNTGIKEITNTNNVPLGISLTLAPSDQDTFVVEFGDEYHYYGRRNAEFFDEAFDLTALEGWTLAKSGIGFGTDAARVGRLNTIIPAGNGPSERGATNHTFTYFKRGFELPEDFDFENDVTHIIGRHDIDDSLILYINGIEVYRFNTVQPTSGGAFVPIGTALDWNNYSGLNINPNIISFNINSDYGPASLGESSHEASLTNLKEALKPGQNVLTAVVGNNSASSSDLHFNLELTLMNICDHTFTGTWTDISSPDCTTPGKRELGCDKNCGATKIETIPALGHDGEWNQTTAPTCEKYGADSRTCTRPGCGANETRRGAAPLGHAGTWVQTTAPTCVARGVESRTCTHEGCTVVDTRQGAEATGVHVFGEWYTHPTNPALERRNCQNCTELETRDKQAVIIRGDANGDGTVTIADALEILKYLAKMNSTITPKDSSNWNNAIITLASYDKGEPGIADVLEILKKLAKMTNEIDTPTWSRA